MHLLITLDKVIDIKFYCTNNFIVQREYMFVYVVLIKFYCTNVSLSISIH